jgi:hypothetical protein
MTQLSPIGLRAVEEIARRTGFSRDAVTSMLFSIVASRGGMAQFSHPEFGGSGQWMAGGSIMISDMFNNALKARVDALCNELSALIRSEPDFAAADSFQLQSQDAREDARRGSSSLLVAAGPDQVARGSWRSIQPRSTERSSLRLFSRHPTPRHRRQWEGDRLRHAGPSD